MADRAEASQRCGAPSSRAGLGLSKDSGIQYITAVAVAALVISPLLPIVYQSVLTQPLYQAGGALTFSNYVDLFTEFPFTRVILDTLLFAALTATGAVVLGVLLSVLIVRSTMPMRRALGAVVLWPLYLSPLVVGFAWILAYGPSGWFTVLFRSTIGAVPWNLYSIPGMAATATVVYTPLAYLYCSGALKLADPSMESAARTSGAGPLRILCNVTLPLLRPPILYSTLLIFTSAIELLSIPLLYGTPVGIDLFASFLYVYGLGNANPDYGILGAAAMILLLVMVVLVALQARLLRNAQRFVSVGGKATRHRPLELGPLRWVGLAVTLLFILFGPITPLFVLLLRAFTQILTPLVSPWSVLTLDNIQLVFSYPAYVSAIVNTVVIALIGGVVTTILAGLAVMVARRSAFRHRRAVETLALVPQAVPGIVVGLGFFWVFAVLGPASILSGTIGALIIAFACRTLPVAFGSIAPQTLQVDPSLDQATRAMGADWWRVVSRFLPRLLLSSLLVSFTLVYVQMTKELSSAIFLVTSDTRIISTTSLALWQNGNTGAVAALSMVQIVITVVLVFAVSKIFKVRVYA